MVTPDDDTMVLHENALMVEGCLTHVVGILLATWRGIGCQPHFPKENVRFRHDAGWRHRPGDQKGIGIGRMGMNTRAGSAGFHDGKMGLDLAGWWTNSCFLATVHINQTDIFRWHKPFADKGWGTEHQIVTDPDRDIAAIAIDILFLPQATADIANTLLDELDSVAVEKGMYLLLRDGIRPLLPLVD